MRNFIKVFIILFFCGVGISSYAQDLEQLDSSINELDEAVWRLQETNQKSDPGLKAASQHLDQLARELDLAEDKFALARKQLERV